VKRGVGTEHGQIGANRYQQDVRNVVASPLVQVSPLLGQVNGLAARDIHEIDHGIGDAAVRSDNEAVEIGGLVGGWIADRGIPGNGELDTMRYASQPFDGAGNGSAIY